MKKNKDSKSNWIWIILILVIFVGIIGVYFYSKNSTQSVKKTENYEAKKTTTTNSSNTQATNTSNNTNTANVIEKKIPQFSETTLSTFSTKIYSTDSARQTNINITCSTLNETTVKNGETFSFCNTVGMATTEKGYQKADIFDKNGNKKKGLGGGNCQISTTLYNAVLAVPNLNVTERHAHSNSVPYIETGKDAAVAYGSYDFKFVNNSGNDIIIRSSSNGKTVDVSLVSVIEIQ